MSDTVHASLMGPLEACDHARHELLSVLREHPAADWSTRASEGTWSLAEYVDHLIRSEIGTSKMVRMLIRGDFRDLVRPSDAAYYDSRLGVYPYGRLAAPSSLVPTPIAREHAEGRLADVHARFVHELGVYTGPDADEMAAPDPATGVWFTLAGWVRLQALHEAHHIGQIRALRTS
jgi:DinB superfamily